MNRRAMAVLAILFAAASIQSLAADANAAPATAPATSEQKSATPPSTPAPAAPAPAKPACPSAEDFAKVTVRSVARDPQGAQSDKPLVALRHGIVVQVAGLETLLQREKCSPTRGKIVLFLDGRPVPSMTPYPPEDPTRGNLKFILERNETSRPVWTHLLGKPDFDPKEVLVSVGISDEYPVSSDKYLQLRVIPHGWFATWAIILVALAAIFLILAMKSDVLRDVGAQPPGGARKPYSLAKMQMAWWFFLILASYLLIGLVTGDYSTSLTSTVLVLMGISAGTLAGSSTIDASKQEAARAAAPGVPEQAHQTRGRWWLDVLSDGNGVNFHRFQMASWTLVLGIIFVHAVYENLAMPEFNATLLGLLGISAGTYLGLKTTSEK